MGNDRMTMSKPIPLDPELAALLAQAKAKVEAMTPAERSAMMRAQRRSWVIGEMMLEHPELSREYVERIYDEAGL
jgi:hypothetical protein